MSEHEQEWVCPTTDKAELFAEAVNRRGVKATQDNETVIVDASQGLKRTTISSLATSYSAKRVRVRKPQAAPHPEWNGLFQ